MMYIKKILFRSIGTEGGKAQEPWVQMVADENYNSTSTLSWKS